VSQDPFSLREKDRMRGVYSYFPLTPTLSRRERE